jgi:prevent-host-death family protein
VKSGAKDFQSGRTAQLAQTAQLCYISIMQFRFTDMLRVTSAEFHKRMGHYQDVALTQPVAVTRNGRERTVLISADEYERLKRRDRQVMTLADFTEADLVALEAARAPEESKVFNTELNT